MQQVKLVSGGFRADSQIVPMNVSTAGRDRHIGVKIWADVHRWMFHPLDRVVRDRIVPAQMHEQGGKAPRPTARIEYRSVATKTLAKPVSHCIRLKLLTEFRAGCLSRNHPLQKLNGRIIPRANLVRHDV